MGESGPGDVTLLLKKWQDGDGAALDELLPQIQQDLRRQALFCLRAERPGHTVAASDLIQDAYLRLAGHRGDWRSRSYFFAAAVETMRRILVDHARRHAAAKRGGSPAKVDLDSAALVTDENATTILAVHEALAALAAEWPRRARIVELRFFGGLTESEIAEALGIAVETVRRDWKAAKGWLQRIMSGSR